MTLSEAIERYENSDGFGECFPEQAVEPLAIIAAAYMEQRKGDWYGVQEIRDWSEAAEIGLAAHAEWLARQLNLAFAKGEQNADSALKRAVRLLALDMHEASSRPCESCRIVSAALGEPFGCEIRVQARLRTRSTSDHH